MRVPPTWIGTARSSDLSESGFEHTPNEMHVRIQFKLFFMTREIAGYFYMYNNLNHKHQTVYMHVVCSSIRIRLAADLTPRTTLSDGGDKSFT